MSLVSVDARYSGKSNPCVKLNLRKVQRETNRLDRIRDTP